MPPSIDPFWTRLLEVQDVLLYSFDVELLERPIALAADGVGAAWLPAFEVPGVEVAILARSGLGAVYARCGHPSAPVYLYVDARGTLVQLGADLRQVVALIVALPYWPELLAHGAAGGLASLRRVAERLEQEHRADLHVLPEARQELQSFLQLPTLGDPVRHLYELAIQPAPVTLWSPHGWRYESPLRSPAA